MSAIVSQESVSRFLVAQSRELLQQGERMEARRCLQQAVTLDPGNADAWWHLGALAARRARMEYWMLARRARYLAHRPAVSEDVTPFVLRLWREQRTPVRVAAAVVLVVVALAMALAILPHLVA